MTEVSFWYDENRVCGFQAKGHTGFDEAGADIVCAALSSACYMAANTVTEVIGADCELLENSDGLMKLIVSPADRPACYVTLDGLELHIRQLSEQYPDEIRIIRRKR